MLFVVVVIVAITLPRAVIVTMIAVIVVCRLRKIFSTAIVVLAVAVAVASVLCCSHPHNGRRGDLICRTLVRHNSGGTGGIEASLHARWSWRTAWRWVTVHMANRLDGE